MKRNRKGKVVVLHLAARYPFAGVIWQLLHHLIGFRQLGLDVYYIEDHGAYLYDPIARTATPDPEKNLRSLAAVLARFGFKDRWSFLHPITKDYIGMSRDRSLTLIREADAVINLCGATEPREEHIKSRCLTYVESDPGAFQAGLLNEDPFWIDLAKAHRSFFTYGYNIGNHDCRIPSCGIEWHPTRPPIVLDEWPPRNSSAEPVNFTTIGNWENAGNDVLLGGEEYFWSKHLNFTKMLEVAKLAKQEIELATTLDSGSDYERAIAGGFRITPAIPMSLDIDRYRNYISVSRGEFTVAKDLYARTRSGWFSDRTASYLAAGRPAITQFTGFEKFIPAGTGLLGFDDEASAVEAIRSVNSDYRKHALAARQIAREYFAAGTLLDEMAETLGL
ncbi:MAG TPA: glycosyltransferase [Candidatus Binataceae bacterium]